MNTPRTDLLHDVKTSSRDRFVDAALNLFVEYGFDGTSLQMIGDRVGVSKAAVYYHFKSKDELLVAVTGPAFRQLEILLETAEAVPRATARRKKALDLYIDYLIDNRLIAAWLSRDIGAVSNAAVWEPGELLNGRIDALLTTSPADAQARAWGAAITQALSGSVLMPTDLTDDELRGELQLIGEYLMRGYRFASRRKNQDDDDTLADEALVDGFSD